MSQEPLSVLVARQAARTPDAVAVTSWPHELTYAELDQRANRLANHLRALGAGPESMVGVCLHRRVELVVALLAVWKAGAAYVPLDPAHPQERLAWIVADTGASVVLTDEKFADGVAEIGARPVRLDADWPEIAECPATPPEGDPSPLGAAYAMYTSGSTGRPKGVVITHEGIAGRVMWTVRHHGFSPADRVLQKTALTFDAAGWEIFAPLVSGGTVVLAPVDAELDPAALVRTVADQDITVLQVVPSVLRLLVEEPGWPERTALRLLFSAGEPLYAELCQRFLQRADAEIWNTYGPTECSIDVSYQRFDPAQQSGPVPIGRPVDGMRLLVLDPVGELVPIGMPGELHVAGPGVARGYAGMPGLTAERFVPDVYGPPGARLYRTGDRVRWRSDGVLEYLGRADHQVKINGVRIEPGEVEAVLAAHPEVAGAAVAAIPGSGGAKRLVAYTVGTADTSELRRHLRERLPQPMVPSVFVPMEEFPLTSSGKIDRLRLPVPRHASEVGRPPYVAPRTDGEREIVATWAALLDLDSETIGADDDFFQLGGSSLLLTRLAGRLRRGGREVVLSEFFTASTVEAQARLLEAGTRAGRITPAPRDGLLPLSSGQRRLWFMDRTSRSAAEWITPVLLRVPAGTEPEAVRAAMAALAERHEVLRTRYVVQGGEPHQVVDPAGPVELRVVDAARVDPMPVMDAGLQEPFDLETGPPWRAVLFREDGADQTLFIMVHHIACDGWSAVVFERDLHALLAGTALPDLPVQYADYAAWQRRRADGEEIRKQALHWRATLEDLSPLELPADRPRPASRDGRGAVVVFDVPSAVADPAIELGRRHGATPFMTLLTAFCALLARYSGQWDLTVGTSVAGRDRPEVENLIGFFLNSLVLRCDLDDDAGYGAALDRVREVCLAAFANQELPFDRLVEDLAPERDQSRTPLYQVMFDMQEEGRTSLSFGTADVERLWHHARTDLTLSVQRQPDGSLRGHLEYATAMFDEGTVRRMAGHLVRLLETATADPAAPLAALEILTPAERRRQLVEWNGTANGAGTTSVPELFAARVSATPDEPAIVTAGGRLTYRELSVRADAYAHALRGLGVGPETVVGVLLDRSPELVACLLGVWRAGGAYVPVHPSTPAERLAYTLENAGAAVVVTERDLTDVVAEVHGGPCLVAGDVTAAGAETQWPAPDPDGLAYVIYTSGSTGRPKGVQATHASLANLLLAKQEYYEFGPGDAWLALAAISFDIAVGELFIPLVTGGRVVLADESEVNDRRAQLRLVEATGVTHLGGSPAHWRLLLDAGFGERPVIAAMGGEPCPPPLARDIRSRVRRFINEYGPSEATVAVTRWDVEPDSETILIGGAFPNMAVYVADENLRLLPPGVPGELFIGGAGVARGYVGAPARTAERFVPDPFGAPGGRLYRTGDLCRFHPDGSLEFLGRVDDQVKVRGYRVEPGEIEGVLAEHPDVESAVVVLHGSGQEARLVAYVVTHADPAPAHEELTAHARRHLPDYMLPGLFIPLERLPLNRHGKLDRAALPDPDDASSAEQTFVAPRNDLEEGVAEVWEEVLGAEIGVRHNFFQAGGNSLLAVRVISGLKEMFDVEIALRELFDRPTVEELAEVLEERIRADVALLTESEIKELQP